MKHKLLDNWGTKLISIIAATLIWMFVASTNDPITSRIISNVAVTAVNKEIVEDIGKVFVTENDTDVVNIKVTERKSILNRLRASDFKVIADMNNLTPMNTVPLGVTCSNASVTWDEMEISPSSMKVKLEDKKEQAFVIDVSPTGQAGRGYDIGLTEVENGKSVYIAGPESLINIIGQVSAPISINGMTQSQTLNSELRVIDKNGAEFTDTQMSNLEIKDSNGVVIENNTVQVKVTLWEILNDIPIQVETTGEVADGYQITGITTMPVTVSLAGTREALAELNGKLVLKDVIDVSGAYESIERSDLDLSDTLKDIDGLKQLSGASSEVYVKVQIEKIGDETVEIPLSNVELKNKPEDMSFVFTPADRVQIAVRGTAGNSGKIQAEEVKVSLDLESCKEEGSYTLPLEIELPEGYTLVSEVTIVVNAKKVETVTEGTETEEG